MYTCLALETVLTVLTTLDPHVSQKVNLKAKYSPSEFVRYSKTSIYSSYLPMTWWQELLQSDITFNTGKTPQVNYLLKSHRAFKILKLNKWSTNHQKLQT